MNFFKPLFDLFTDNDRAAGKGRDGRGQGGSKCNGTFFFLCFYLIYEFLLIFFYSSFILFYYSYEICIQVSERLRPAVPKLEPF